MTGHTPGPWHVDYDYYYSKTLIRDSDDKSVALTYPERPVPGLKLTHAS